MKPILTKGIVLGRTDFGEADRIITVLTPDQGKLRLMAKGVRKVKSKLAGGIELFSVSDLTFMVGKREIGTLISTRLTKHYATIIQDIDRVQVGYELIKLLDKITEDQPEADYFNLLQNAFKALDDKAVDLDLIRLWFQAQLLKLAGHTPNLKTDTGGERLAENQSYNFDLEAMSFVSQARGKYNAKHIKFVRLVFSDHSPEALSKIEELQKLTDSTKTLVNNCFRTFFMV